MKKYFLCKCGSGKIHEFCCSPSTQVRLKSQTFSGADERQAMLDKVQISATFDMRYRGLFEFYGEDLITYKIQKGSSQSANDFLRYFSSYLTDYLEDHCPSAWKNCNTTFWEEFIFVYFPSQMKVSSDKKQVEIFLSQLKKFVRWLDQRHGMNWFQFVKQNENEFHAQLKLCENLLNHHFLKKYPRMHHHDWDFQTDIDQLAAKYYAFDDSVTDLFEVIEIHGEITMLKNIKNTSCYSVIGLSKNMLEPGIILNVGIGKMNGDLLWTWVLTNCIYPENSSPFFKEPNSAFII